VATPAPRPRAYLTGQPDYLGIRIAVTLHEFGADPDPGTLRLDDLAQLACDVVVRFTH